MKNGYIDNYKLDTTNEINLGCLKLGITWRERQRAFT